MSHRFLTSAGVLAVAIGVVSLLAVSVVAQAPTGRSNAAAASATPAAAKTKTPAKMWIASHTPWGDPDLQGIWRSDTITPLERPRALGEKPVLADEEAAEYGEELRASLDRNNRAGLGTDADVARAYNDHWFDKGAIVADGRTSLIVDPPDGRIPPLTPEAQKKIAARAEANARFIAGMPNDPEDLSLPVRCIIRTDTPPYRVAGGYNNNFQIFQSPGYVAIYVEMIHSARLIPVDGRSHLGQSLRQWLGDTRGHWEGQTLVIETSNFRPDGTFADANPATFHLVERFTRVNADMITYEFRVEDPTTWTKPWAARIPWKKHEEPLFEYACHEGNYDIVHLLAGARVREKATEEAAKKGSR